MIAPLLRAVLLSIVMKCFDLIGELCDQPIIQLAAGGNFLEQGPVSKAYHFEEPVDGVSLPVQVQLASAIPGNGANRKIRSEEHTSELQSLMRISYAVFCLKNKKKL